MIRRVGWWDIPTFSSPDERNNREMAKLGRCAETRKMAWIPNRPSLASGSDFGSPGGMFMLEITSTSIREILRGPQKDIYFTVSYSFSHPIWYVFCGWIVDLSIPSRWRKGGGQTQEENHQVGISSCIQNWEEMQNFNGGVWLVYCVYFCFSMGDPWRSVMADGRWPGIPGTRRNPWWPWPPIRTRPGRTGSYRGAWKRGGLEGGPRGGLGSFPTWREDWYIYIYTHVLYRLIDVNRWSIERFFLMFIHRIFTQQQVASYEEAFSRIQADHL